MAVVSCSVDKYIPEGEHMLTGVAVTCDDKELMKTYLLGDYVVQQTNSKWFGARVPLKIYMLSGTDTTKRSCRFWRRLGEAPVLYTVLKEGETMTAEEAEKYLRQSLAPYKIPIAYEFISELPRTAAGKADRKALSAMYKEKYGF